eukprot:INCI9197.1.p2 GENE.INCI9197.1~~INCI9197.1.p2  ORF type:complete len:409 (+),score=86.93 INCI9197.1:135-1361(+)
MSSAATRKIFDVARRIPKVELHLHLDGSLSAKFIRQKCEELQLTFPVSTEGEETEVHKRLCKWIFDMKAHPEKMKPFLPHQAEQIGSMGLFDWMNQFLQTKTDLTAATLDVCHQLQGINVCYAEIRFCPTLHTHKGLSEAEALKAVQEGFSASKLDGGIIVCALRTFDAEHGMRMAKLAHEGGAVGFDVAGYETGSPLTKHADAIKYAVAAKGLGVTVHAGEWVDQGNAGNLETALSMKVNRVGHALELLKSPQLMQKYIEAGIHIEANPISNTKWLPNQDMSKHPLRPFYEAGLSVGINSDNYLFSGTPQRWPSNALTQVVAVHHDMGLSWDDIKKITLDSMNHAFCPLSMRKRIQSYMNAEFDKVLSSAEEAQEQENCPSTTSESQTGGAQQVDDVLGEESTTTAK